MSVLSLPSPVTAKDFVEIHESDGYTENSFEGKMEQMKQVVEYISSKGFLPAELTEAEVAWYYKYVVLVLLRND